MPIIKLWNYHSLFIQFWHKFLKVQLNLLMSSSEADWSYIIWLSEIYTQIIDIVLVSALHTYHMFMCIWGLKLQTYQLEAVPPWSWIPPTPWGCFVHWCSWRTPSAWGPARGWGQWSWRQVWDWTHWPASSLTQHQSPPAWRTAPNPRQILARTYRGLILIMDVIGNK